MKNSEELDVLIKQFEREEKIIRDKMNKKLIILDDFNKSFRLSNMTSDKFVEKFMSVIMSEDDLISYDRRVNIYRKYDNDINEYCKWREKDNEIDRVLDKLNINQRDLSILIKFIKIIIKNK